MLEAVLQQLSNLRPSYKHLASNHNSKEGSSSIQASNNPLFEGRGGVHTRSVRLEFSKFDGFEPMEWILKAQ